jgi:hypothetical protein
MLHYVRERICGKVLQIGVFPRCDHPQQELHRLLMVGHLYARVFDVEGSPMSAQSLCFTSS